MIKIVAISSPRGFLQQLYECCEVYTLNGISRCMGLKYNRIVEEINDIEIWSVKMENIR